MSLSLLGARLLLNLIKSSFQFTVMPVLQCIALYVMIQ